MRLDELYKRVRTTARVRFLGSRRLTMHQRLSQWAVTLSSALLIAIPLLQAFGFRPVYSAAQLNAIQGILAIVVLAYSLLLTQENFAVRSERMHHCGIELNRLAARIEPFTTKGAALEATLEQHDAFAVEYHDTLDKHENHSQVDYLSYKVSKREDDFSTFGGRIIGRVAIVLHYIAGFFHYVLLIVMLLYLITRVFLVTLGVPPGQTIR